MQNILTSHTKTHDATTANATLTITNSTYHSKYSCLLAGTACRMNCLHVQRTMYMSSYACDADRYLLINLYEITSIWPAGVFRKERSREREKKRRANIFDKSFFLSFIILFRRVHFREDLCSILPWLDHKRSEEAEHHFVWHFLMVFINHINFLFSQYMYLFEHVFHCKNV